MEMVQEMEEIDKLSKKAWNDLMHIDIQGAPDQVRRRRDSYGEQSTYTTESHAPAPQPPAYTAQQQRFPEYGYSYTKLKCCCSLESYKHDITSLTHSYKCPIGPKGPQGNRGEAGTNGFPGRQGYDGEDAVSPPSRYNVIPPTFETPQDSYGGAKGADGVKAIPGPKDGVSGSVGKAGRPGKDALYCNCPEKHHSKNEYVIGTPNDELSFGQTPTFPTITPATTNAEFETNPAQTQTAGYTSAYVTETQPTAQPPAFTQSDDSYEASPPSLPPFFESHDRTSSNQFTHRYLTRGTAMLNSKNLANLGDKQLSLRPNKFHPFWPVQTLPRKTYYRFS
ncbi:hypothetical protein WR25_04511 [Diploscapter pachys]|uniref:Nematode cuticle collagen N-terminal domain-containing protein n=1 Tax=Diploscapter pachys TaxID=2018661 RepID=A0A2A2LFR3_9BILA|nr:hypothetical protein WR25_04511 [Diploscapter pachys]